MDNDFYCVYLCDTLETYYFHEHENAVTFLLESYFDDFNVETEEEVININNEVADTDAIEDYAYIVKEHFED